MRWHGHRASSRKLDSFRLQFGAFPQKTFVGVERMLTSLPVINLETATFECTFGRGCDGICCQNGRPSLYPEELATVAKAMKKVLPHLRPEAREVVEAEGFHSRRMKFGGLMLRVVEGWCIFFNKGCVLHKVGAAEGDAY